MSIKAACCVGCLITVAILAGLFGINGLLVYQSDKEDYDTLSDYSTNVSCNLTMITIDSGSASSSTSCPVWHYYFQVGPLPGSNRSLGLKQAYGNFWPKRCFGRFFNVTAIGTVVTSCFTTGDGSSDYVRVTELTEPDKTLLAVAAVAVSVSFAVIIIFVVYNVALWCGVCADVGPFSRQRRLEREGRVDAQGNPLPSATSTARDPFDLNSIRVADRNWLSEITFDNAYARAVLKRFASLEGGADADEAAKDTPHRVMNADDPDVLAVKTELELHPLPPRVDGEPATSDDSDCCICFERFREAVVFPCLHFVCADCVEHLARNRVGELFICPLCRRNAFPVEMRRVRCPAETRVVQVGPQPVATALSAPVAVEAGAAVATTVPRPPATAASGDEV